MSNCREASRPLVSVIVLAYNAEATIDATIEALVNQQCDFDFEIVVGDDASTDGTRLHAEKWVERYPEIVRLMPVEPNKGLVRNYFDCLETCRGKYVTDCSAGDMFTSAGRLQKLAMKLEERGELAAVVTDAEGYELREPMTVENYLAATGREQVFLSAMMFRACVLREAILKNREMIVNEKFGCEDLGVVCALLASGRVVKIEDNSFRYKVGEGSASKPDSPAREMRFHGSTLYALMNLAKHYDALTPCVVKRLRKKLNHLADIAFFRFDKELYVRWREAYGLMSGMRGMRASLKNLFIEVTGLLRR